VKLVVGLGNPGISYRHTRHNIGASVIEDLARRLKIRLRKEKGSYKIAKGILGHQQCALLRPLKFMNLSGGVVKIVVELYDILPARDLLVICDDLDLELGRLRMRYKGSSSGHRGLQSIIDSLQTNNFARLRLGIGRPCITTDASSQKRDRIVRYVLSRFSRQEQLKVKQIIQEAGDLSLQWLRGQKE
jgi:PTH1 family peptidyl-tRNA hydrolase